MVYVNYERHDVTSMLIQCFYEGNPWGKHANRAMLPGSSPQGWGIVLIVARPDYIRPHSGTHIL